MLLLKLESVQTVVQELFRWCSTPLYRCPNAGVFVTDPTLGLCRFCTGILTMLHNYFDVDVHRTLSFSIQHLRCTDAKTTLRMLTEGAAQMQREKLLKITDAAAKVLTHCRVGYPMPRSMLPGGFRTSLRL
jgi:hypothetical protein